MSPAYFEMKTISQVAAQFGISRSTLLYYDRVGLCSPPYRTSAGYRLYSEEDILVLEQIRQYRNAGMPVREIKDLLDDHEPDRIDLALKEQLSQINVEMASLRKQQALVLSLLKDGCAELHARIMDKASWINLLRSCGMNDADMRRWHVMFEKQSPQAHQDFLESLGIPEKEIKTIRNKARTGFTGSSKT